MQYNALLLTFVFAIMAVALAVVALALHKIVRKDGRDAAMHTHQVLARRRQLQRELTEKKGK